jgi:hypothetical protein
MIHDRFDIERWKKLFPLSKLRAEARAYVEKRHAESPEDFDSSVEEHAKLMSPSGEIEMPTDRLLMWGDVGSVFQFLGKGGEIHWTCQSF